MTRSRQYPTVDGLHVLFVLSSSCAVLKKDCAQFVISLLLQCLQLILSLCLKPIKLWPNKWNQSFSQSPRCHQWAEQGMSFPIPLEKDAGNKIETKLTASTNNYHPPLLDFFLSLASDLVPGPPSFFSLSPVSSPPSQTHSVSTSRSPSSNEARGIWPEPNTERVLGSSNSSMSSCLFFLPFPSFAFRLPVKIWIFFRKKKQVNVFSAG